MGRPIGSLDRVIRSAYPQRGRRLGRRTATLLRNAGRTAEADRTMAAVSPLDRASGVEPRTAPADALTGLYERHAGRVFQYCLSWLRSREEAEDAAQTTFLYAYRGLDRGVVPTHERGWLLSIARNVCLSRTDAARRRAVEVAQDPHALEEIIAAPAPSNELDGLRDALATLTEQQRAGHPPARVARAQLQRDCRAARAQPGCGRDAALSCTTLARPTLAPAARSWLVRAVAPVARGRRSSQGRTWRRRRGGHCDNRSGHHRAPASASTCSADAPRANRRACPAHRFRHPPGAGRAREAPRHGGEDDVRACGVAPAASTAGRKADADAATC